MASLLERIWPRRSAPVRIEPEILPPETRGSLENPAVSLDDPVAWMNLHGAYQSSAGLIVTPESVLGIPAALAAVKLISNAIGTAPLYIYRRDGDRRVLAEDHPLFDTLRLEPNPRIGASRFKASVTAHALLWGNGYAWIERDRAGRPTGNLWQMEPWHTRPRVLETGDLVYQYDNGRMRAALPSADVLHIAGLEIRPGEGGIPIVTHMRNVFGLAVAGIDFSGRFYRNGAIPSVIFETPPEMPADAASALRHNLEAAASGLGNAHRIMVTPRGVGAKFPSSSMRDAQQVEREKHLVVEIARIFQVPPPMIQDLERATFSNIEEQGRQFVQYTLGEWRVKWTEEIDRKLLRRRAGEPRHFTAFDLDDLQRAEFEKRMRGYSVAVQSGVMTRNEARRREDLPDIDGLDDPLTPVNTTPGTPPADPDGGAE